MKVVLDTNVLFAAISTPATYRPIIQAFWEGVYQLCVTTDILDEYIEILQQRFQPGVAENIMEMILGSPETNFISNYYFWNLISADPDDNKFVDCAISANVDFIVTDDKHFRVLKEIPFPSVSVISADDFVEILTGKRPAHKKKAGKK
ncbi:MAG: putative toxin-antitoxin system toxin component, PIN family [Saprospiraceae bacterium]|nr:putative toxin-antitoxin system toxin component, PIN family [Saprospiraceae bacterium]